MALLRLEQSVIVDGRLQPAGMYFEIPVEDLEKAIRKTVSPKRGRGRPKASGTTA